MDEQVAHALIDVELQRLQKVPYRELAALVGRIQRKQVVAADGKSYELEIEAIWDTKKGGDVRLIVAADDGGWRAFKPLTDDFIMRPDGSIVGESLGRY